MTSDSLIRYSVVVPFYNEQENIPPLYMKLTEVMDSIGEPYELVFVDDGSKDDSFKVLSEIYEHDRRVNLVRLRRNFGQTAGLKAGFDFARGEVIISMDGDLQHDPDEIPKFLEKIEEGYDLVSGWRHQRHDHRRSEAQPADDRQMLRVAEDGRQHPVGDLVVDLGHPGAEHPHGRLETLGLGREAAIRPTG